MESKSLEQARTAVVEARTTPYDHVRDEALRTIVALMTKNGFTAEQLLTSNEELRMLAVAVHAKVAAAALARIRTNVEQATSLATDSGDLYAALAKAGITLESLGASAEELRIHAERVRAGDAARREARDRERKAAATATA